MPSIIPAPAQGARQLGAMSLAEASRLSERGFSLRMARLQELKRNHARLLRIMAQLRENRERKKAADDRDPALGGFGATGGGVGGAIIGGLVAGPPGAMIGASTGAALGGGLEESMSGDLRAGTEHTLYGTDWVPSDFFGQPGGGGGQTGFPSFGGSPGPG